MTNPAPVTAIPTLVAASGNPAIGSATAAAALGRDPESLNADQAQTHSHSSSTPHPLALRAFSKSGASGLYDRARPTYPPEALADILASLPPAPHEAQIVELGAGTGIFTRNLITALKEAGRKANIRSVEPSEGMREGFQKAVIEAEGFGEKETGVKVGIWDGEFADVKGVGDKSVDLIVVAQAFHWIGRHTEGPLREFARILKPGGNVALIWNLEDRESAEWVAQIRTTYEAFEFGAPQYHHMTWKAIYSDPVYAANFSPPKDHRYHRKIPATKESIVDRVLSKSYITDLDDEKKEKVKEDVEKVVEKGEGKAWIDKEKGIFEYPYWTDLVIIQRK